MYEAPWKRKQLTRQSSRLVTLTSGFSLVVTENEGAMDNETVKHLWALRKANEALIEDLKLAVLVLRNENNLSEERRKSLAASLERLIAQSKEIYGEAPGKANFPS